MIFPAKPLICAQNSIFEMMRARSGLVGVRGAAVRDDGGPPSVPGRGRGGPLQQHRQHGGQVGRSSGSGSGRRLRSAVRTVQVSQDMEQGGQGYLQRGMSYYLYLVRRTATRNRTTIRKVLHNYIDIRREVVASY